MQKTKKYCCPGGILKMNNNNLDLEVQKGILQILNNPPYEFTIWYIDRKLNHSFKLIEKNIMRLMEAGSIKETNHGYMLKK